MYQKPVLGIDDCMAAMQAMLAEAGKEPNRPISIAIVDDNGDMIACIRMDRAAPQTRLFAFKKAYTAARARANSGDYVQRMKSAGISIADIGDANLIALQGGVFVPAPDGSPLGGIGVSGLRAEEDEAIAKIGLAAMKLQ